MLKLLRDSAMQSIAGIFSLLVGIVALLLAVQGNNQTVTIGTSDPVTASVISPAVISQSQAGVTLPFDASYDVNWSNAFSAYSGIMSLEIENDRSVMGQIYWTLTRTVYDELKGSIGLGAAEYIRGQYDPASGTLEVDGFERDDPYVIIGLGNYTLIMRDNGDEIAGFNYVLGERDGTLTASRR